MTDHSARAIAWLAFSTGIAAFSHIDHGAYQTVDRISAIVTLAAAVVELILGLRRRPAPSRTLRATPPNVVFRCPDGCRIADGQECRHGWRLELLR